MWFTLQFPPEESGSPDPTKYSHSRGPDTSADFADCHGSVCLYTAHCHPAAVQLRLCGFGCRQNGLRYTLGQNQTTEPNVPQILRREIFLPVEGDVAALHNQILVIFNGGTDHFPDNGPKIICQFVIVHGRQGGIPAADQTHFQVIHG